jgi:hypothetical protein
MAGSHESFDRLAPVRSWQAPRDPPKVEVAFLHTSYISVFLVPVNNMLWQRPIETLGGIVNLRSALLALFVSTGLV